jgi:dipeptidyl-peptidase III
MKNPHKAFFVLVCFCSLIQFCVSCKFFTEHEKGLTVLTSTPEKISVFNEILVKYDSGIVGSYNSLLPQERVFTYYLFRAGLACNRITADQINRNGLGIIKIFETIVDKENELLKACNHDEQTVLNKTNIEKFITDAKSYLVFLWTSHGQYFQPEHSEEKRTPGKLGLTTITKETLAAALKLLKLDDLILSAAKLEKSIFDAVFEPTTTVLDDIQGSACNLYSEDFKNEDYEHIAKKDKDRLNAYFYIEHIDGKRIPKYQLYSSKEKYGPELSIACYWLRKAYLHALKFPTIFDKHLSNSLDYLVKYLHSGNEELFRKHSIEWIKSSSRIDYNFGFIESYDDPKNQRGSFQSEVTIKTIDMAKLNGLLVNIEKKLPFDPAFKRDLSRQDSPKMNASINQKIFGFGHLGPMLQTAAYCLPNYEDIRAEHGSKQIIYPAFKSPQKLLDPNLCRKLFYLKNEALWLEKNDLNFDLDDDIWTSHCILHETIGHGSGNNKPLNSYNNAIEELRAEIIALYVCVNHLDELTETGMFSKWYKQLGKEKLIDQLILDMAKTGFRRLMSQKEGATTMAGDHAMANYSIMNYLLDHGGLSLVQEGIVVDDKDYSIIGLEIIDRAKTLNLIEELMIFVQKIKSTGDSKAATQLIEKYGLHIRNPEQIKILKNNREAIVGKVKATAVINPIFKPMYNNNGTDILDVHTEWPEDIFDQYKHYSQIELSTS